MGNKLVGKTAEEKLQMRKEQYYRRIDKKYSGFHSEWVMFVGPANSGKTTLFNTLIDQQERLLNDANMASDNDDLLFPPYKPTERTIMGLKVFDSYNDKAKFPLSCKFLDLPGTIMEKTQNHIEWCFQKPSIIFITFDASVPLEPTSV